MSNVLEVITKLKLKNSKNHFSNLHMWPKLWTHLTKTSLFKVKRVIAV